MKKQVMGLALGVIEDLETKRVGRKLNVPELLKILSILEPLLGKFVDHEQELDRERLRRPDPLDKIFDSFIIDENPEESHPRPPTGDDTREGGDREDS